MKDKVLIIAEAGVNHNGDLDKAYKLIDIAADSGADYVKFQTFKADKIVNKSAKKANYQIINTSDNDDNQYNMLKKLELPEEWHTLLRDYASSKGIHFLSTGFDEDSILFLHEFGVPFFKIPSGELTNKPYIEFIASLKKPVVLSTGMADINEIKDCIEILTSQGINKSMISILHCNTEYPTPMQDVNLYAMKHIENELGVSVGYSDHTLGIEIPIAAVALGAKIIEKHFTIDKELPGPDHKASLDGRELKEMVTAIRNIELAISGNGLKTPSESEMANKTIARKSIHLASNLPKGTIIEKFHLCMKRPGDGISPMEYDKVIGSKTNKILFADDKLNWNDLEI